jgi:hypothetical protein
MRFSVAYRKTAPTQKQLSEFINEGVNNNYCSFHGLSLDEFFDFDNL